MTVAVGLFAVVMVVSISALLALIDANRKAQAMQSVMNNLNIAIDGMVRSIREGNNYRCGSANPGNPDCPNAPGTTFYFTPSCTSGSCATDWIYDFRDGRLWRSVDGTLGGALPLTSPEVTIDSVAMYVIGATRGDSVQPKVMIVIKGTAGAEKVGERTSFHIQSTAVQRVLDI